MNEFSTVDTNRAVLTESQRKDAQVAAATQGQGGGNKVPPESIPEAVREAPVASQAKAQSVASLNAAVENLNEYVQSTQRDLRFSVDSELSRPVVRVIDASTDKVVRQIPSELALRLARNLQAHTQSQAQISQDAEAPTIAGHLGLINTRV